MENFNTESEATELTMTGSSMSLVEAVSTRRSVRGFLDKEVPQEVLDRIFEIAQQAPSNCNVQPWKAYVASGELKESLKKQNLRLKS